MKDQVTIKDIAKRLNVSISTVSRALKDHPRIGAGTKARVLELARELDYQPNVLSLNLLNNRSNTIGIIVPKISYHFYSLAISGIEEVAIKAGYTIMICQSNESFAREVANTQDLTYSRVAGLIVSQAGGTQSHAHFQRVVDRGIPLIFFNRVCEELEVPKVIVDNYRAAYTAVEHLVEQGCRRIALLAGPSGLHISNQRLLGYLDALRTNGLPLREELISHSDFTHEEATRQTKALLGLPEPPDGIFAVSDRLAISAMTVVKARGLKIPEEVALVGFNNDPVASLVSPSLSSVDQDAFEIGKTAAQLFFSHLGAGPSAETRTIRTRLVVRESSDRRGAGKQEEG
jgi:DNA-binding LacI/PurR family transcriptional regulator